MLGDLSTIANVKEWAGVDSPKTDPMIGRLISSMSQAIRNYCQRDSFLSRTFTETYDGSGSDTLLLRQFPVTSISGLSIDGVAIPAATPTSPAGFTFDSWSGFPAGSVCAVSLCGYGFREGRNNVTITYTAGYLVQGEAHVVPASPFQVAPSAPYGAFAADGAVAYANGTKLTPVASAPAVGQYIAPNPFAVSNPSQAYTFAAADAGQALTFAYSFIPTDVEQCLIEWAAERLKYRTRIGEMSHATGGSQTASFTQGPMPKWVMDALNTYSPGVPL